MHRACFLAWFGLSEVQEFRGLARKNPSREPVEKAQEQDRDSSSFFHGKFRKYSAELGGSSYILKVKEAVAPELPDVEYISNRMAGALGIPVAKFYLIDFLGERAFVTKNFVENKKNEDLKHIYHYQPDKIPRDCETLLDIIADETNRFTDVETFIRVCLFDSLIGNHDRHGRNLGLLVTAKGSALSPIYDNPSALGLESGKFLMADFNPTGRIPTKDSQHPTPRDYAAEFYRLGYWDQVQAFSKKINMAKLDAIINEGFCSDQMKTAFRNLVHKRGEEFQDAVSKRP
ncbi:MAG: hypothetical protein A2583_16590 [Bdellovibrionales bacterium RIFOXYD1_FULL_53_11]|nr:MAG: hypothetical protein A2583_16590 [Bdellovibrionales bacterium RIFOXYD1_FULL_53_11]